MTAIAMRSPYLDPQANALLAAATVPRKALLLDRDGVINSNHGYVHTPEQTDWIPGIFDLVAQAHQQKMLTVVVTNQAGIGRGYYSEDEFLAYTAWVHAQFAQHGTPLLATFWCPHHPDAGSGTYKIDCNCRKPAPGMLNAAAERFALDMRSSWMIGDQPSDMAAAAAAGVGHRHLLEQPDDLAPTIRALAMTAAQ